MGDFLTLYLYYIKTISICQVFSAIKFVDRKGIEPHPTNGHQCYYASLDLSNDIETHGASIVSTPVMP